VLRTRHPKGRGVLAASALALLAAGCTLKTGPGPKPGYVVPAFKRYVVEHPIALAERTLRVGSTELRLDRVVVEEHRTVLGPETWVGVLHATVVNHGGAPLLAQEIGDAFQIHGRSGTVRRGYVFTDASHGGGWLSEEHTKQPRHLPAGAAGRVRVQAEIGTDRTHDDPSAMTFRDLRLDFR
jgi:hypothetical protein